MLFRSYLKLRVELPDTPGSLAGLTADLASVRANIHDISHDRRTKGLMIGATAVQLLLETRGQEHTRDIISYLQERGYSLEPA